MRWQGGGHMPTVRMLTETPREERCGPQVSNLGFAALTLLPSTLSHVPFSLCSLPVGASPESEAHSCSG